MKIGEDLWTIVTPDGGLARRFARGSQVPCVYDRECDAEAERHRWYVRMNNESPLRVQRVRLVVVDDESEVRGE